MNTNGTSLKNDTSCYLDEVTQENMAVTAFRLFFSALIAVCGSTGNALVILAFRNPRMKTVTNLYIANLAFADLLVSVINVPTASTQATLGYWPFGLFLCKVIASLQGLTLAASVGTLIAIAVDRFNSIVRPFRSKMKIGHAKIIICVVWLTAAAFSSPLLIYSNQLKKPCTESKFGCIEVWTESAKKIYTLVTFLILYLFPLTANCILYCFIGRKLTNAKKSQTGSQRAKWKVIRMLLIVVVTFAVCCLPFHVLFLCMDYIGKTYNSSLIYFVQWLFYANSACNPIVYAVFNTNYRQEFVSILKCRPTLEAGTHLGCGQSRGNRDSLSNTTIKRSSRLKAHHSPDEDYLVLHQNGISSPRAGISAPLRVGLLETPSVSPRVECLRTNTDACEDESSPNFPMLYETSC